MAHEKQPENMEQKIKDLEDRLVVIEDVMQKLKKISQEYFKEKYGLDYGKTK